MHRGCFAGSFRESRRRVHEGTKLGYARCMQWLVFILAAIVVLAVLSFVISALKWLLVVAAILVVVGLLTGVLPGRGSGLG